MSFPPSNPSLPSRRDALHASPSCCLTWFNQGAAALRRMQCVSTLGIDSHLGNSGRDSSMGAGCVWRRNHQDEARGCCLFVSNCRRGKTATLHHALGGCLQGLVGFCRKLKRAGQVVSPLDVTLPRSGVNPSSSGRGAADQSAECNIGLCGIGLLISQGKALEKAVKLLSPAGKPVNGMVTPQVLESKTARHLATGGSKGLVSRNSR